MIDNDKPANSKDSLDSTVHLALLMSLLLLMLIVNMAYVIGYETGRLLATESGWWPIAEGVGRALVISLPTILISMAVFRFTHLFWSCGKGDVFTAENVKTLRLGGDFLVASAIASALLSPTFINWMDGADRGFEVAINDLAPGNFAIGFAIHGLAVLFQKAVEIKAESDQII